MSGVTVVKHSKILNFWVLTSHINCNMSRYDSTIDLFQMNSLAKNAILAKDGENLKSEDLKSWGGP